MRGALLPWLLVVAQSSGWPSRWNWVPVWAAVAAGALIAAVAFNIRAHRATAELARAGAELTRVQSVSAAQTRELARINEAFAILIHRTPNK